MVDLKAAIVRHSVGDVINILEDQPATRDFIPGITIVQIMNRLSIAHLSIERALKFLVMRAGGPKVETHDLKERFQALSQHDHDTAMSLEEAFGSAVRHYRYNPNAANAKHLETLNRYFEMVGSDHAFQNIRYWELTQSLEEILLGRLNLLIHLEILHGLRQLLRISKGPIETTESRVERIVRDAMWPARDLAYEPGTPKEQSVKSYIGWMRGFSSFRDALADAVKRNFIVGDEFAAVVVQKAYRDLLSSKDPAVKYFATTLDVLPRQSRDVIPCVEWLGPEKELRGLVNTPAGTNLGFVSRGQDKLWYVEPFLNGTEIGPAKANTQTDARAFLATMLTQPATVTVGDDVRILRIVGGEDHLYFMNLDEMDWCDEGTGNSNSWTHKVTFWNDDHGIRINQEVRIEVRHRRRNHSISILTGEVKEVSGHIVFVAGEELFDLKRETRG